MLIMRMLTLPGGCAPLTGDGEAASPQPLKLQDQIFLRSGNRLPDS